MPTKQQLHDAVDHLPDHQVDITYRVLLAIADEEPISPELERRILDAVAGDDEPYTDQQKQRDLEAHAAHLRGESVPHEDVLREFGL